MIASTSEITPLTMDDGRAVIAFLRHHYGDAYYGAAEPHFRWLYELSPCRWFQPLRDAGRLPGNAIISKDGELLGVHLYLPFDAKTPWGGTKGIFDEEWINDGTIRGGGRALASRLLQDVDVYCGLGCNSKSKEAFVKMGLSFFEEIPRLATVLDRESLASLLDLSGFADAAAKLPRQEHSDAAWYLLESCGAIPDHVLESHFAVMSFGAPHDRARLEWRFDQHPAISYSVVASDPDGADGAAIVRVETAEGTTFRVARVVDMLGSQDAVGRIMASAAGFALAQGCIALDFMTSSATVAEITRRAAAEAGLMLELNPPVPYMYQPCTIGEKRNVNMVLWTSRETDLDQFAIVKSDSTQDVVRTSQTAANPR